MNNNMKMFECIQKRHNTRKKLRSIENFSSRKIGFRSSIHFYSWSTERGHEAHTKIVLKKKKKKKQILK